MSIPEELWFLVGIGGFLLILEGAVAFVTGKLFRDKISADLVKFVAGFIIFILALVKLFNLPSNNTQTGSAINSESRFDWTLVIASLALALSSGLAALEWLRYRIPLQMRLREVVHVGVSEDTHLVLLRLSLVNQSTRGRTVYDIGLRGTPDNVIVAQCRDYEYNEEGRDTLIYELSNNKNVSVPIRSAELLWLPLDIPPHQSRSGFAVFAITMEHEVRSKVLVPVVFVALDVFGNTIAKRPQTIELKTYMPR